MTNERRERGGSTFLSPALFEILSPTHHLPRGISVDQVNGCPKAPAESLHSSRNQHNMAFVCSCPIILFFTYSSLAFAAPGFHENFRLAPGSVL